MEQSPKREFNGLKFGSPVLLERGGHVSPAPGQYRLVRATYIGARGGQVCCRLDQDDPDACVGYCTKKDDVGWWGRSIMRLDILRL